MVTLFCLGNRMNNPVDTYDKGPAVLSRPRRGGRAGGNASGRPRAPSTATSAAARSPAPSRPAGGAWQLGAGEALVLVIGDGVLLSPEACTLGTWEAPGTCRQHEFRARAAGVWAREGVPVRDAWRAC